jgi:Domain of unknown function (DUF4340)
MNPRKFLILGGAAAVLLAAGIFFSAHRASQQSDLGGRAVFADLKAALGEVSEIRLSKGDGSLTTLRRGEAGWVVAERNFPADNTRVRELALALANLRVVEAKTSDAANYARLGVESPDSPTATSTLVEVKAGEKAWSLIVGKGADNRTVYVRKPDEKVSLLAEPLLTADPEQKRWMDRLLVDLRGAAVRDLTVKTGKAATYQLTRAKQGDAELALTPVPKGRAAASNMVLNGQVESLVAFNFEEVRALPSPAPVYPDSAIYRTFDGQVIEFAGRRDGDKTYITVKAQRDPSLVAPPAALAAPAPTAAPEASPVAPVATGNAADAEPRDNTAERLATRTQGVEFEVPAYKYEGIFKPFEELLEPK